MINVRDPNGSKALLMKEDAVDRRNNNLHKEVRELHEELDEVKIQIATLDRDVSELLTLFREIVRSAHQDK